MQDFLSQEEAVQGDGWQRVQMEFDWAAMRVHCFVNGEAMRKENAFFGTPGLPEALPFGPEADETVSEDEGGALHASLRGGFRRIYLFTWLEADCDPEEAPEVRIGDMWVEPGPAPRRAALPLAKAGPVAERGRTRRRRARRRGTRRRRTRRRRARRRRARRGRRIGREQRRARRSEREAEGRVAPMGRTREMWRSRRAWWGVLWMDGRY